MIPKEGSCSTAHSWKSIFLGFKADVNKYLTYNTNVCSTRAGVYSIYIWTELTHCIGFAGADLAGKVWDHNQAIQTILLLRSLMR